MGVGETAAFFNDFAAKYRDLVLLLVLLYICVFHFVVSIKLVRDMSWERERLGKLVEDWFECTIGAAERLVDKTLQKAEMERLKSRPCEDGNDEPER